MPAGESATVRPDEGAAAARRGGAPLAGTVAAATVNVMFGLVIVALKLLVH